MFPADSLNPQYCEEQAARYAAKRLAVAHQAAQQTLSSTSSSTTASPNSTRPPTPQNQQQSLRQAFLQRPELSRSGSAGLLGNIFQGFVRATSTNSMEIQSKSAPTTPTGEKSQMEALIAERKKDADICAMPSW